MNSTLSYTLRSSCLIAMLSLFTGCLVRVLPGHPVPGPVVVPAPGARAMSYDEAVYLGTQYCRNRGFTCDLKHAHMTGNGVWKINLKVEGNLRGQVHLDYDAYSRALLKADEQVREHRGHGHDDDDDDHGHGRGHGHDDD